MKITNKGNYNIELILNWNDFEHLDKGNYIETRYDGENKILIHRIHPCDPSDYESKLKSLKQREYAEFDRRTMDINIYIPHGVLKNSLISASKFSKEIDNLKVIPEDNFEFLDKAFIKVVYPGSWKIIEFLLYTCLQATLLNKL